jgi:CRP/FNR family cyclic AMP-dependent transcriptional regulator
LRRIRVSALRVLREFKFWPRASRIQFSATRIANLKTGTGQMADNVLDRQNVHAGTSIFEESSRGDNAFIVQEGSVKIVKTIDGKEVVLGSVGQGGIFGEMALIDDFPRMATARAAEPTTYIVISRNLFEQKLGKSDPFIRGLLKIFAGNIRSMSTSTK